MMVMSRTPLEKGQPVRQHEHQSQGNPWDNKETPRKIPGRKGSHYNRTL
jgi:hypothetical protein